MKSTIKVSFLVLVAVVLFTGCKKKTDTPTAMLMLHIHTNIDTDEVDQGSVYTNAAGQSISLNRAEYYISGIKLTKTDGSTVDVSGTTLVQLGIEEYSVGNVPTGSYKSISFNVGVQSADNHKDPSTQTGALAVQNPVMNYSTTANGYIFLAVAGLVDSNASGTPNKAFSYQIGTDALLKNVTLGDHSAAPYNAPYVATANGSITIHIIGDYGKLFGNTDMIQNSQTNSTDVNAALGSTLAGNIPSMFDYEE
ncbi:MAG: hypothetical protein JSS76_02175 [Bacteroidetes bacterium]|nr:hypothetical protein [Bacteroidota bacterium]